MPCLVKVVGREACDLLVSRDFRSLNWPRMVMAGEMLFSGMHMLVCPYDERYMYTS